VIQALHEGLASCVAPPHVISYDAFQRFLSMSKEITGIDTCLNSGSALIATLVSHLRWPNDNLALPVEGEATVGTIRGLAHQWLSHYLV
jgi:hypothetical protein